MNHISSSPYAYISKDHLSSDEIEFMQKLVNNSYQFSCASFPKVIDLLAYKGYIRIKETRPVIVSALRSFSADLTAAGEARLNNLELEKKLELTKLAIEDWKAGKLSNCAAMFAISSFIMPQSEISEERGEIIRRLIKEKGRE